MTGPGTPRRFALPLALLLVASVLVAPVLLAGAGPAQDALAQARTLRRGGRPDEAAALLRARIERAPDDGEALGLLGLCLLDAGQVSEAAALAPRCGGAQGGESRRLTFLGRLALVQGRPDEAAARLAESLEHDPAAIEPATLLVSALLASGKPAAAVEAALRLEQAQPDLGGRLVHDASIAHAERLLAQGDEMRGPAVEKYLVALERVPGDKAAARSLLDLLVKLLRVDDLRRQAARLFPGDEPGARAERAYWEGRIEDELGHGEAARAAWEAALAADPGHAPTRIELARLDVALGEPGRAVERLADLEPALRTSLRVRLVLGTAFAALGRDDEAEVELREVLQGEPGNTKALYQLGRLLVRTGRAEEGRRLLAQVAGAAR